MSASTSSRWAGRAGRSIAGWVFVYGSLVGPAAALPGARLVQLTGFARGWGVAMDNRVDLPGYKYYTDPGGRRPPVRVAFVDIGPASPGATTLGVLRPVDEAELRRLDDRERNYHRIRVDDRIEVAEPDGDEWRPVWAYVGTAAARARFATGPTVIDAAYRREVLDGFAQFGPEVVATVRAELVSGPLPVCELVRHDLPPAGAAPGTRAVRVGGVRPGKRPESARGRE